MNKNKDSIIFNSLAKDSLGLSSSTNRVLIAQAPFTPEDLGELLIQTFKICKEAPYLTENIKGNLHEVVGIKTVSQFVKEYVQVMITLDTDKEIYVYSPMKRYKTKGYLREKGDMEIQIPQISLSSVIGETLMKSFEWSK
ncbi:hypothetical protein [Paenibacillus chitinolyticus]|uniref:hypothetical protein n=1 Tax=Paenibacillus chitinolyticus TaxID=79263 RepID=UPI00295E9BEA|nr:hypothetical protein [Paenibacillus chitinolyticus]